MLPCLFAGQVYKRVPLLVRYTACGGLFNQHYSHVAALSLALALGGDVVLPAAVKRDSFANYFSQDPTKNQVCRVGAGGGGKRAGEGLQQRRKLLQPTKTPQRTRWAGLLVAREPGGAWRAHEAGHFHGLLDLPSAPQAAFAALAQEGPITCYESSAQRTLHPTGGGPQVSWTPEPFHTLWDGEAVHAWLRGARRLWAARRSRVRLC